MKRRPRGGVNARVTMRESRQVTKQSLAGSLLLAHPRLRDPNFRRAVVLMSLHNAEGAMGVVLNRPTGQHLSDLTGDFALGALASVPLFNGGPVQTEQLLLVAWQPQEDGFRVHFGVEPEKATQLMAEEGTVLRGFMGYSGWSAGQLEEEMSRQTWIVADVPSGLLGRPQDDKLWQSILRAQGDEWRLVADEPEDLSLN